MDFKFRPASYEARILYVEIAFERAITLGLFSIIVRYIVFWIETMSNIQYLTCHRN